MPSRRLTKTIAVSTGVVATLGLLLMMEHSTLIPEGTPAPDFTAKLSNGETVSLSSYKGRKNVVLFFYPKDFTRGCTQQVCSYRDRYADITALDAVIVGVSFDSERSHQDFIREHNLPFPLISDPDKSLGELYGATRFRGLWPMAKRVTYVIDRAGIIRKVAHHEFAIEAHLDDILETLRELQQGRRINTDTSEGR